MTIQRYDVAVIGSGAGALTAALVLANEGASVIVAEAEDVLGGTSAIGGGNLWIPGNPAMVRQGKPDSLDDAYTYLRKVSGTAPAEANARAFLANGAKLVQYLEDHTDLRFTSIDRPDYHPDWPGAAYGRSLEPEPFEASLLGDAADWFRINPGRDPVTYVEGRSGISAETVTSRRAGNVRTQGAALIAGLGQGCVARGVRLERNAAVVGVSRTAAGFALELNGEDSLEAGAIVIGCGGFGANPALRRAYLPSVEFLPLSSGRAQGDALTLGLDLGASLSGIGQAWLGAAHSPGGGAPPRMVVRDLALPGSMLIDGSGKRFVNESLGYNDVGSAMLSFDPALAEHDHARAWLLVDERFRTRYAVLGNPPSAPPPQNWLSAPDVALLAQLISVPEASLADSIGKMNTAAETGIDPEFGRGGDAHQRFNGDEGHRPNPCLGPLDTPPYYAVPMRPGICSTKGGLAVNEVGQVIGRHGVPLPGVFACGDAAESVMGFGYAGAGASIGPAMTFAMLAAHAILLRNGSRP